MGVGVGMVVGVVVSVMVVMMVMVVMSVVVGNGCVGGWGDGVLVCKMVVVVVGRV